MIDEQAALPLEPTPPPSAHVRLRQLHDSLRRDALEHHGQRRTSLPSPTSKSGKSLDARLAKAIRDLGPDECERILRWRHQRWIDDPKGLTWSTDAVWSPKSLAKAREWMAQDPPPSPSTLPRLDGEPEHFANDHERMRWRRAQARREHEAVAARLAPEDREHLELTF